VVRAGDGVLHIETPNAVVNITVGLTDDKGHRAESIAIVPDTGKVVDGSRNNRVLEPNGGETWQGLQAEMDASRGLDVETVLRLLRWDGMHGVRLVRPGAGDGPPRDLSDEDVRALVAEFNARTT
jgi:hypothetical protein